MVLCLVADLFFSARIRETAKQLDVPCEILRDPAGLLAAAQARPPKLIVIDMEVKTGDAPACVQALKADARTRDIQVVGYLHDARDDLIRNARAVGCDMVLSRGGLTKKLPDLISRAR
jgi:DNA-binding NarL/FixJ family response regulator